MSKRTIALFLVDIFIAFDRILRYSQEIKKEEDLWVDEKTCDAILREFGILGEAMKMLLESYELKKFTNPEWRIIVDFRNFVIHEYFGIEYEEVFKIIKFEIPSFYEEMLQFAKLVKSLIPLRQAIQDSHADLLKMKRIQSAQYLQKISDLIFENVNCD